MLINTLYLPFFSEEAYPQQVVGRNKNEVTRYLCLSIKTADLYSTSKIYHIIAMLHVKKDI